MHSSKLIFILLALLASQTVFAQDTALQNATTELTSDVSTSQSSDLDEEDEDLKKRKLEIGIILTAGIFLVGLFLVAVTLIYGRRTRRQIAAGLVPPKLETNFGISNMRRVNPPKMRAMKPKRRPNDRLAVSQTTTPAIADGISTRLRSPQQSLRPSPTDLFVVQ